MNKKTKRGIILTSLATIAFAGSLLAGSTYALFTSESTTNIAVTSGKVSVTASITDFKAYTPTSISSDGSISDDTNLASQVSESEGKKWTFGLGGTATLDGGKISLDKMAPGDYVTFKVNIANSSTVTAKYRTKVIYELDNGLSDALKIKIGEDTFDRKIITSYQTLDTNTKSINPIDVKIELPSTTGDEYQNLSCTLNYIVEAVQGNAIGATDSYPVYPAGVTTDSFGDTNTLAYVDTNGSFQYSSSFQTLVVNASISEIYCKANSSIVKDNAHLEFNRNLTIYGNGADFNKNDLSVGAITSTVNLNIYDAKDLMIWGKAIKTEATLNLYEEGCSITGTSRTAQDGYLLYTKGSEESDDNQGTLNATFKSCKVSNTQFGYSTSSKGNTTFESCIFKDCGAGVKTKLKSLTNGTRVDTIKNCLFINCGIDSSTDKGMAKYLAPLSYSNDAETKNDKAFKGTLTLNSINNKFYKSIGDNGDILLGDTRDGEAFRSITLNVETEESIKVRKAHDTDGEYVTCSNKQKIISKAYGVSD